MAWTRAALLLAALAAAVSLSQGQVLTPPIFNLAENKRITATATCGEDVSDPELYCQLTGGNADKEVKVQLIQGQVCDYCDPSDPERSHPASNAIDGSERWWQSPPLSRGSAYNEVNVTLDLGQEFHVAYVFIRMANSPRPGVWVLERSRNHGETYEPWSYFADTPSDCQTYFGSESLKPITADDDVRCETQYSKVVPLENGEIPYSLLNGRPSKDLFTNSTILREWTRATNIRLRLLRAKTLLGHLMSVAQQVPTVTRRYFYSIKDISVGGRCVCNGHADLCDPAAEDQYRLLCRCQHNTCGDQCQSCCPPFVQKRWKPASYSDAFQCEACNCNGHSNECEYDEEVAEKQLSMDIHGNYDGGGVCQNCRHHTTGINCHQCEDGYYRPVGVPLDSQDVCQPCDCAFHYSTGSCAEGTGKCECRPEFQAPDCDDCSYGYYGYPDCRPCDCHLNGTRGNVCEVSGGQCPCKANFEGQNCDRCAPGYFNFPACEPCECNPKGSVASVCDVDQGQCDCLNNFGGRQCDQCQDGYFRYPDCEYCNCDSSGTEPGICDKAQGTCQCRQGYGGKRCDQCAAGYFGYPNCRPCDCYVDGSTSTSCSATGKCQCLSSFSGLRCEQCSPGHFNFPACTPCDCHPSGAIGVSCSGDGTCRCKPNFDGVKCDTCRDNFYNFPLCEGCNCDPAGVTSSFAGCDSVEHLGELCECKPHVTGRICDTCRPLFWNLRVNNPDGCEDCDCNPAGTVGGVRVCDSRGGQCPCKPNVASRQCQECSLGSFKLAEANVFGCQTCNCDIGGAVNDFCDKYTGQCACRPRVTGPACSRPLQLHYFPDLYQYKYEAEDGRTAANSAVRFGYDENQFPGYSWRGYAVFSPLQREIIHDIWVEKPSLYRMVMRYVNPRPEPIVATVQMTPENPLDIPQNVKVRFDPSREAALVTVSGAAGDLPSPLVLNPGRWTVTVQNEVEGLYLDYFALLPAAYYEGTILQERATEPCYLGQEQPLCLLYAYPDLSWAAGAAAAEGFNADGGATQLHDDQQVLDAVDAPALAQLDAAQPSVRVPLTVDSPGRYILVVHYVTPPGAAGGTSATVQTQTSTGTEQGQMVVNRCDMTMLCRQVTTDKQGRVFDFNFDSTDVDVVITSESDEPLLVDSVVAIPARQWHMDYVQPRVRCVRESGECANIRFPKPPESSKVEFESGLDTPPTAAPGQVAGADVSLVRLDANASMVDVRGQVPEAGPYVFVVHYYQPDHPELELPVLLQNGQFYEGRLRAPHCAATSGCRAVVEQADGNKVFNILENFMFTLKDPTGKGLYVDYLYAIPERVYNWEVLEPLQLDRSAEFIRRCGPNHYQVDPEDEGFCRDAIFSLTTDYNNGALECQCDSQGSESFECRPFGGQCPCKPHVIGRQCSQCQTGYFGFPDCRPCDCPSTALCDDATGECICPPRVTGERCDQCVPLTYGFDPLVGCEECNCAELGVVDPANPQCDLETGQCRCKPNIVSRTCDRCQAGSWAYPYCQLCNCDVRGTTEQICSQETAECFCKDNVEGRLCDQCRPGTYNMAESNPDGCTRCFCFGKTESCTSSFLFWYEVPALREMEWDVAAVAQTTSGLSVTESKVTLEVRPDRVRVAGGRPEDITYFAPGGRGANMLGSYGGQLRYTVLPVAETEDGPTSGADVILTGANMTLLHYAYASIRPNLQNDVTLTLEERFFRLPSGPDATREQLMQVLQKLDGLYIKATYLETQLECTISNVTLEMAVQYGDPQFDRVASSVEECACPSSYTGLSCEECAPGHYRAQTGPYGGYCVPCNCNGHSDTCDPLTGRCFDCQHSTTGDHCEKCIAGYHGDATGGSPYDCLICACPLPIASNNFADSCEVSPDGLNIRCECQEGYYGARCQACAAGYFGTPEIQGGSCQPCQCSGNIDTMDPGSCDSVTGDCLRCLNNTSGPACNLCATGYFGDAVVIKDCQACSCDKCGTAQCDIYTGGCTCLANVEGAKCDRCSPNTWGFRDCQGCRDCECAEASESTSCDYETGQCRCRPGAAGRRCDQCASGYWNYGPSGCQSCNCNEEYAYGVGCNPQTGQCECLRGVEGPRCERCPYRWILIPGQGCEECDSCVHDLLDTTDGLAAIVRPLLSDFESYAGSFLINQKLRIMNETYLELRPRVDAISGGGIDITPLKLEVESLEKRATDSQISAQQLTGRARQTQEKAVKVRDDALDLEKQIDEVVRQANSIVASIIEHAQNLQVGAGHQISLAISEAESLLAQIRARDFGQAGRRVEDELSSAIALLERVREFRLVISGRWEEASQLRFRLNGLEERLADLRNQSSTARDKALRALELISNNRVQIVNERIGDVNTIAGVTNDQLTAAADWLEKARTLLAEARVSLASLSVQAERLLASQAAVQVRIDQMTDQLDDVTVLVRQAQQHAMDLMMQAQRLDNMLADTRLASDGALRAANSYKDIVAAIEAALAAARAAQDAAESAGEMTEGVGERALDSRGISEELLQLANGLLARVVEELQPQLAAAKESVAAVERMNSETRTQLTIITEALTVLERYQLEEQARQAATTATDANAAAVDALDRVGIISGQLEADLDAAYGLARDMEGARKAIKLAAEQVEAVEGILPNMRTLITSVDDKFTVIRTLGVDVGKKVAELRRKVAVAREKANSIGVGVEFDRDMTLRLKNPEGLDRSATSTDISFYFRTDEPNGFLLYLGNEVGTKNLLRRTTSDDFISVEVVQGNLNVLVDLGSGPQRIINDAVYVSDGVWRQAVISRKGRQVKVKVISEDNEGRRKEDEVESVLPGSKSVFNLDQARSVLHVGGFPTSAKVQDNVRYTTLKGAIEDLKINDVPVGLWNFVSQTNLKNKGAMVRDKLVKLVPATGLRFNGFGYTAFETQGYSFAERFSLQLRFKTFSDEGLLFFVGDNKRDFMSIEMVGGDILFQYSLGDGPATLRGAGPYNDGAWHVLEASRDRQNGVLKIDSQLVDQGQSPPGSDTVLDVSGMMYFGGYPDNMPFREVTNRDFEGCMDDVSFTRSTLNLGTSREALGVTPGCPARVATDVSFAFGSPGYVKLPLQPAPFQQLALKFKTAVPEGLLFYSTNEDRSQYVSISLRDGGVVLRSQPGGEVTTASFSRYADDQWHVVTASFLEGNIRLEIDDYETFLLPNPVPGLAVTLNSPLYFGGLPASVRVSPESAASLASYTGCLGDATLNNVFVNFADATERPNALLEKCPLHTDLRTDGGEVPERTEDTEQVGPRKGDRTEAGRGLTPEEEEDITEEPATEAPETEPPTTTPEPTEPPTTTPEPTEPPTTEEPTEPPTRRPPPVEEPKCGLPLRPNEDGDITEYSGQRFGNRPDSRWEFSTLPGKIYIKSSISVEFKTTAREGIIFYAAAENQIDFIALYLKDGNIVYAFDCGSGEAVISSEKAYNDDTWHTARFDRNQLLGELYIDDELVASGESVGNSQNIQVDPPFFLGGLSEEIKENERLQGNVGTIDTSFNGCLRNLRMYNTAFGNPARSVAITPCSNKVEQGAFFSVEGGYMVAADRFRVGITVEIELDIRPRKLGGVLLAVHGKKDFLLLQMMENGKLLLTVENGRGEVTAVFNPTEKHQLCDGNWHTIKVVKVQNVATMTVDSTTVSPVFGVAGVSSTDTYDPLYVGGVPSRNVRGLLTQENYVGCIRNLHIKNKPNVGLGYAKVFGAVTANTCPLI